ncbi:zinc ribbon domain-containing protein [Deminuibacter soli]|uniref:zinc ribbon domain-containing protein n=1 Tax=Deminuibacter soli TaxID=2291815 RepID=UPI001314623D|nr:zinc ribbon domain-containing protein [Deminuibacter soli]
MQLMGEEAQYLKVFNMPLAKQLHARLPVVPLNPAFIICGHCRFVNEAHYHFCTNCGAPVLPESHPQTLYRLRMRQRLEMLSATEAPIQSARVILYLLTAFCGTGVALLLSEMDERYVMSVIAALLAVLFGVLAWWSRHKPFTALLISFVIVATFSLIAFVNRLHQTFATLQGVYGSFISIIVLYILLRGIRNAYRADIIKAELDIL